MNSYLTLLKLKVESPVKNDWIDSVKENLTQLNMNIKIEELEGMSKKWFKNQVKEKVRLAAFNYLQNKASQHSKMIN